MLIVDTSGGGVVNHFLTSDFDLETILDADWVINVMCQIKRVSSLTSI